MSIEWRLSSMASMHLRAQRALEALTHTIDGRDCRCQSPSRHFCHRPNDILVTHYVAWDLLGLLCRHSALETLQTWKGRTLERALPGSQPRSPLDRLTVIDNEIQIDPRKVCLVLKAVLARAVQEIVDVILLACQNRQRQTGRT